MTDPICGARVGIDKGLTLLHLGNSFVFCSDDCRERFIEGQDPKPHEGLADVPRLDTIAPRIAYFSMEVAAEPSAPTYAGGLGVLAGDFLRSCADLKLPVVAVTLLYGKGYFRQKIDGVGRQEEAPVAWDPETFAVRRPERVTVQIEGRKVAVAAWEHPIRGITGHVVPLVLLDTDVPENTPADRELTATLYGGDTRYRLAQEIVLGIGGVRMLHAMGHDGLERYHMNEGHAGLLPLELLKNGARERLCAEDVVEVRRRCVFTTHTPVPAGHDHFPYPLVKEVLGEPVPMEALRSVGGGDELNMTRLGLNLSGFINGVAKRHGEVSQEMFPGYPIEAITNGVHSRTWTCEALTRLFDAHIPEWGNDPTSLRHAMGIPREEIWSAHQAAKGELLAEVSRRTGTALDPAAFTIGFARRVTPYKRLDLMFSDAAQLCQVAEAAGPVQIVLAGKAHPKDTPGKELIRLAHKFAKELAGRIPIVFLEDYDMHLGKLLTSGVDLWLNTPRRPMEASGTSGMKAAHNGVPSLSVLDGWWIEGCVEGVTGWAIGNAAGTGDGDAHALYDKLEQVVLPLYYGYAQDPGGWIKVMKGAISKNASYFNSHRMMRRYVTEAYLR